jgi:hypothetical protein
MPKKKKRVKKKPYWDQHIHERFPRYNLDEFLRLFAERKYQITTSAISDAQKMEMDKSDIVMCATNLKHTCFSHSMESEKLPGTFQDVYRVVHKEKEIYLKLQILDGTVVVGVPNEKDKVSNVISFKERKSR